VEISLEFPMYAISGDEGDHFLDSGDDQDGPTEAVMVFTTRQLAENYLRDQSIDATIVRFANGYRFLRFLEGLKDPSREIVCDATQDEQGDFQAGWSAEVQFLIENVLPPLGFAWDYPLHFIFDPRGLASIRGTTPDGRNVILVAIFTDEDLAERYMRKAEVAGQVGLIGDEGGFLEFVNDMADVTEGIIVDPTGAAPGSIGNLCISKSKLIEHLSPDQVD